MCRRRGNDNYLKCTYVLPDGVTHTRGYVKDPEEVNRYLNQEEGVSKSQQPNKHNDVCLEDTENTDDRKKVDLTKNVSSIVSLFSVKILFEKLSSECVVTCAGI